MVKFTVNRSEGKPPIVPPETSATSAPTSHPPTDCRHGRNPLSSHSPRSAHQAVLTPIVISTYHTVIPAKAGIHNLCMVTLSMLHNRIALLLPFTLMLLIVASACGSEDPQPQPPATPAPVTQTLIPTETPAPPTPIATPVPPTPTDAPTSTSVPHTPYQCPNRDTRRQ